MPFRNVNNVSILPKYLPYREDQRNLVHYIHQDSASSQDLCDMNLDLCDRIFGNLMSNNTSIYTFNESSFESGIVAVVSHFTSIKYSGVDIDDLASRLVIGRATDLIILESTNQLGVRKFNFSMWGRRLRSRHDRLYYKSLPDRFYSDTTYVRPKFQSLHGHRWELPVLHYQKIMVIYPFPFLVVITQLFSCIIFINGCIYILTGSPV